jgi:AAA domain, putative AbiEii toxin, Type IV TA system
MSCTKSQIISGTKAGENSEYLMIESFELRNFRCFEDLKSTPLKRFNIIVGESASGKTALMEGLFLMGGANPEIYLRLRGWRGLGTALSINTKDAYESLFRDLFYNFQQSEGAWLSCNDSVSGRRSLDIYYKEQDSFSLPLTEMATNAFRIDPIIFKWEIAGVVYESKLDIKDNAFKISGSAPVGPVSYHNAVNSSAAQNVTAFSSLSRRYEAADLLEPLKTIFPFVENISIETVAAGESVLYVSVGLPQKLPLGDLSGGINKFLSIALGILANPGGLVLVDEIEDGFYYQNLPYIWCALVRLCEKKKVQLIATTHSKEFLKSVVPSLESSETAQQFQLMRLEKTEGQPEIKRFQGPLYRDALASDFEVRG